MTEKAGSKMNKKINKRIQRKIMLITVCLISGLTITAAAAPSIRALHENQERAVIQNRSTDGSNTAEVLAEFDICSGKAESSQYMQKDQSGTLVPTPLSDILDLASSTVQSTGENGNAVPDDIATVEELIDSYCSAAQKEKPDDEDINLDQLDQLTYWLDLKFESTNHRVIAGTQMERDSKTVELDNGMVEVAMEGQEITRAAEMTDFVIIQIDAQTGEIHYLTMKEYNSETGAFVAEFPCIGPYMITQKIR